MSVIWAWRDGLVISEHLLLFRGLKFTSNTSIRASPPSVTPARESDTSSLSALTYTYTYTHPPHNRNKSIRVSLLCLGLVCKCAFSSQVKLAFLIIFFICEFSIVLQYDLINVAGHSGDQSAAIEPEFRRLSATAPHQ